MTGSPGTAGAAPATVGDALAAFVVETPASGIPDAVRAHAALLVLDALGTAVANRDEPFVRASQAVVGASAAAGPVRLPGADLALVPEAAAEVLSVAVHGSDLDATHIGSIIHPTAIGVPVALAVGEASRAAGAEVLAAATLGMEALIRLGLVAGGRYHVAGFQPTALLGPVIAALVSARLRGRRVVAASEAAGLATAIAAGLRSFSDDGTWGKRLITGWACRAGIHADELVAAGYRGTRDGLEKRWGLFPAFLGPDVDVASALTGLGTTWHLLDTEIKRYPCSHGLHPFIASALALRAELGAEGIAAIERVECAVNAEAARWWFEPEAARYRPDPYAARFSIPYTVARALADGAVDDPAFTADAVAEASTLELVDRVRSRPDPALEGRPPVGLPGALTIVLRDGRRLERDAAPHATDDAAFARARFLRTVTAWRGADVAHTAGGAILGLAEAAGVAEALAPLR